MVSKREGSLNPEVVRRLGRDAGKERPVSAEFNNLSECSFECGSDQSEFFTDFSVDFVEALLSLVDLWVSELSELLDSEVLDLPA